MTHHTCCMRGCVVCRKRAVPIRRCAHSQRRTRLRLWIWTETASQTCLWPVLTPPPASAGLKCGSTSNRRMPSPVLTIYIFFSQSRFLLSCAPPFSLSLSPTKQPVQCSILRSEQRVRRSVGRRRRELGRFGRRRNDGRSCAGVRPTARLRAREQPALVL